MGAGAPAVFLDRDGTLIEDVGYPSDPDLVDGTSVVVAPRVRDALALVDGLARLLDDEPLRRKVAAGGTALMVGRSWEEIAATHRTVYAEVLRLDDDSGKEQHA